MHPSTQALLEFFKYEHLPPHLQEISKPFHDLAHNLTMNQNLVNGQEMTVALRKLLESKDCAVRSCLKLT